MHIYNRRSLEANIALVQHNARVGADIAKELARVRKSAPSDRLGLSDSVSSSSSTCRVVSAMWPCSTPSTSS